MSVSGVAANTYLNYAKRIGRVYLHSTFGTGMDEFMSSMDKSIFGKCPPKKHWYSNPYNGADWSNLGTKFKDGFKAIEQHEAALRKAHGGSWLKTFWHQVKTIPEVIGNERKAGVAAAKTAGKSAFWGGFKGVGNGLMKRMPLIGGLIAVATQVPNIISAFTSKDGGVGAGLAELGKAAGKLGLETAGFMVGQALIPIPFVGGIIGSIAAGWLGEKILGKSFTEKQEEAQGESPTVPGWVPYVAQNESASGSAEYPAWTPIQPTMTDEQIMQAHQYLQRELIG
ncbi:MAG: hypothetical protein NC390_06895 [Fusobacterium sp.]|nr:hypothetical protein [Fusobacterium sp.]